MFKAMEMSLARFTEYQQRAVHAGYIDPPSQPSATSTTSSSIKDSMSVRELSKDDSVPPLESKDLNWKLLPKWNVAWKKENDLEAFLKTMSNFHTTATKRGKRSFAEGVACQCWLSTFSHIGGSMIE